MKTYQFKVVCIFLFSVFLTSCSKEEVPYGQNELEKQGNIKDSLNNKIAGFPKPGEYIYGPTSLVERESGTFEVISPFAENITWYYRDTEDYPFLQGGTGNEFKTHFYLRGENVSSQVSQVKAVFSLSGEIKTAIRNVVVTPADSDDGTLENPDEWENGPLEPCSDTNPEPCKG